MLNWPEKIVVEIGRNVHLQDEMSHVNMNNICDDKHNNTRKNATYFSTQKG